MQIAGKIMYVNFVKKDGVFKGNAFVRFLLKEDSDRLLKLYQDIKENPEKRSVLDSKSLLQIGTRFLEVFKYKQIE